MLLLVSLGFLLLTAWMVWCWRRRSAGSAAGSDRIQRLLPIQWAALAGGVLTAQVAILGDSDLAPSSDFRVLASTVLLAIPVALVGPRARRFVAAALVTIATLLALVDVLHLRYFSELVPLSSTSIARQAFDVRHDALALLEPRDAAFGAVFLACLAWLLVRRSRAARSPAAEVVDSSGGGRRGLFVDLVVAAVLIAVSVLGLSNLENTPQTVDEEGREASAARPLDEGWVRAHAAKLSSSWAARRERGALAPERRAELESLLIERSRLRADRQATAMSFGALQNFNVVVIQVEALDAWTIGARVDGRLVAPFLTSLAERSFYVPRLLDQTSAGRTSDAEYIVFNSLHPLRQGYVAFQHSENQFVALPQILRRGGYSTLAAHAFKPRFWNREALFPRYGFERLLFRDDLPDQPSFGWGLADGPFLSRMVDELEQTSEPYFAYLITLSSHSPYRWLPDRLQADRLPVGELEGTSTGYYLQTVHYVDAAISQFFGRLEQADQLDNTMVAIFGDHTASGLDPNAVEEFLGMPKGFGPLHRFNAFTPFILSAPENRIVDWEAPASGGLIDVGPTLLHVLGIESPDSFLGQPLIGRWGPAGRWRGMLAVEEERLSAGGRCVDLAEWQNRPSDDCTGMRWSVRQVLEASELLTRYDLAGELAE